MPAKAPNESNFHHFVPKSALRRFTVDGAGKQIWVFDKSDGRSFPGGLKRTGSGQGYNTLRLSDGSLWNFEDAFQNIDDEFAATGNTLATRRRVDDLDPPFKAAVCTGVAVQFLRTPKVRTTLDRLPRQLVERLVEAGLPALDDPMPSEDDIRKITLDLIANRDEIVEGLLTKIPILYEPAGGARFWTSDHPIVREGSTPDDRRGVKDLGVAFYAPISSDLLLGLVCPSILAKLTDAPIERLELSANRKARLLALRDGLLSGRPVPITDDQVMDFNLKQVGGSERFVYAHEDAFEPARTWLKAHPEQRAGAALFSVGRMGSGPPRPEQFKEGQWLVLYGRDNWVQLPIGGYDPQRSLRQAWTDQPALLRSAMRHAPFAEAQIYYPEGSEMIRDINVVILERGPRTRFKLVPSDPGMAQLDAMLRRGG
ncbi:DUF4238 domain-containing protein [Brevundimonas sanguinis]|jgi:hypothetical protein|uniref:DUF4238 domain-containing protein n=1 Tax=Brevundimonas TaxID=41275 RepID=UPI0012101856|nr:DUF4238 domain-containing protein [Brevundimonas sp. NCCP 15609]RZJ47617.1 MAG: DUF4238 domain-containing protein [Brevundimonas sp.]